MRVLLTGGAGFVGSHLVEHLSHIKKLKIIVLDNLKDGTKKNLKSALKSKKVFLYKKDIRNYKKYTNFLKV